MTKLIEFPLASGGYVIVESHDGRDFVDASPLDGVAERAQQTFEQALDGVQRISAVVREKIGNAWADETEVKFGLKLSAEAGIILANYGGEANLEVTLKWMKGDKKKEHRDQQLIIAS